MSKQLWYSRYSAIFPGFSEIPGNLQEPRMQDTTSEHQKTGPGSKNSDSESDPKSDLDSHTITLGAAREKPGAEVEQFGGDHKGEVPTFVPPVEESPMPIPPLGANQERCGDSSQNCRENRHNSGESEHTYSVGDLMADQGQRLSLEVEGTAVNSGSDELGANLFPEEEEGERRGVPTASKDIAGEKEVKKHDSVEREDDGGESLTPTTQDSIVSDGVESGDERDSTDRRDSKILSDSVDDSVSKAQESDSRDIGSKLKDPSLKSQELDSGSKSQDVSFHTGEKVEEGDGGGKGESGEDSLVEAGGTDIGGVADGSDNMAIKGVADSKDGGELAAEKLAESASIDVTSEGEKLPVDPRETERSTTDDTRGTDGPRDTAGRPDDADLADTRTHVGGSELDAIGGSELDAKTHSEGSELNAKTHPGGSKEEDEDDQVLTFEEFKKKMREQGEGQVPQEDLLGSVPTTKKTTLANYASFDCGAKVIETNSETQVSQEWYQVHNPAHLHL